MSHELIAVVDLETTGTDPKKDRVIEACFALVHVDTAQTLEVHSHLFHADANPAEAVNGIGLALLAEAESPRRVGFGRDVVAILAHNARFDSQWDAFISDAPWLCTQDDFRWPRQASGSRLVDIALAHGVAVTSAHRAYTDVLTLCAVLERVHETVPLREQLAYARLPRKTFKALVSYDTNALAKQAGFRWQPETKSWLRRMLPDEATALPFKVLEVAA